MSAWLRALAIASLVILSAAGTARAQTPAQRANALNEEGRTLMFASPPKYADAAAKFRQAIVLSPEGRFYYNLCIALYSTGDFGNALMSCQAVEPNGADEHLKAKVDKLIEKVKSVMRQQGMNPDAVGTGGTGTGTGTGDTGTGDTGTGTGDTGTGTGDTGTGTGDTGTGTGTGDTGTGTGDTGTGTGTGTGDTGTGTGTTNPVANPNQNAQFRGAAPPSLFTKAPPTHDYTYTLGAALVAGPANIGDSGGYGSSLAGIRLLGDLLFSPRAKIGGEGYIDFINIGEGDDQAGSLNIFDIGVGLYKHFCKGRMCITPMGGVHLVGYNPSAAGTSTDYASIGVRPQISFGYALGSRYEHYITANLGVDLDLKPIGSYSEDPIDYALGRGGSMVMFSLGYQYRFNTPFGQSPFFQLE